MSHSLRGLAHQVSLVLLAFVLIVSSPAGTPGSIFRKGALVSASAADTWEELDARPLPGWYDEAKFGIFLHWGVFSVPAFGNEWFQENWQGHKWADYIDFVEKTEKPGFAYQDYAARFTADLYRPDDWANIFANAGAQYVVLTSKHHEGFCNWNSSQTVPASYQWNAMDVGPRRDLLGDLQTAVKQVDSPMTGNPLKFGVYHSLLEFFHPLYIQDKANDFTTQHFIDKPLSELYDLVERYEPDLIWSDGAWEANSTYWNATDFLTWLVHNSSVKDHVVYNDRWGQDTKCKHGSFWTCHDRYDPGTLVEHKWENALTIDQSSWGYNRRAVYDDYLNVTSLVHTLVKVVAFNGNLLLNVGPRADGTIDPIFVDRLSGMGDWLRVNGEAIYSSRPWKVCQNETASSVYYTRREDTLYAILTEWPVDNRVYLDCPVPTAQTTVRLLGFLPVDDQTSLLLGKNTTTTPPMLSWNQAAAVDHNHVRSGGMEIQLPRLTPDIVPCQHAWTLVLTGLANF
jgi:alpha-L-fucosidase